MNIEAPNLPDLIIGMKEWLKTCENEDKLVSRRALASLLIKIGLASEMETALSMMESRLQGINTGDKWIEWIDFARMFMRVVFRSALLAKLEQIQQADTQHEHL
jgi:hypothetical protein